MTLEQNIRAIIETNFSGYKEELQEIAVQSLLQTIRSNCNVCCDGDQEEKAKLCQKSYLAGMEHGKEQADSGNVILTLLLV